MRAGPAPLRRPRRQTPHQPPNSRSRPSPKRARTAASGAETPRDARWRLIAPTAHEIICHNDWSRWNGLLRDGHVEVMLDWDLAGPGTRVWDVATAAYCWAPLFASVRTWSVAERARRLRLFLDAYDLDDRSDVLATMRTRLIHVGRFIESEARSGDVGMTRLVDMNVPTIMFENDVRYLDEHWATFERARTQLAQLNAASDLELGDRSKYGRATEEIASAPCRPATARSSPRAQCHVQTTESHLLDSGHQSE